VLERVESALEDGAKVRSRLLESSEGMKEQIRDEAVSAGLNLTPQREPLFKERV
jgi:hypothetical protein